jgi:hypothetical protein
MPVIRARFMGLNACPLRWVIGLMDYWPTDAWLFVVCFFAFCYLLSIAPPPQRHLQFSGVDERTK